MERGKEAVYAFERRGAAKGERDDCLGGCGFEHLTLAVSSPMVIQTCASLYFSLAKLLLVMNCSSFSNTLAMPHSRT